MNYELEKAQEIDTLGYIYQENELFILDENNVEITIFKDDPEMERIEKVSEMDHDQDNQSDNDQDDVSDNDQDVLFKVLFTLPPTYPEVEPLVVLESEYLLKVEIETLTEAALNQCRDSLGDAMIYNTTSFLKEKAEETIKERIDTLEKQEALEKERIEQEEARKYHGSKVTRDSFLAWQVGFVEEAKVALKSGNPLIKAFEAALAVDKLIQSSSKLTGRQLFEKDLSSMLNSDAQFGDGAAVEVDKKLLLDMKGMDLNDEKDVNLVLAGFSEDD